MSAAIDLNADLGELPWPAGRALDARVLAHVTSASVACGGHAGDADTMRATFAAARAAGVRAGAHPSYPDREGFGRRTIAMNAEALGEVIADQVAAAREAAEAEGVTLGYLKAHGALYHDASAEPIASVVAACAQAHGLDLIGPPRGMLLRAARERGLRYLAEGFADRAYEDGEIVPRSRPGAVIEDTVVQAAQAVRLARGEVWPGGPPPVATICLHGDTPGAAEAAGRIRAAIEAAGIVVRAP